MITHVPIYTVCCNVNITYLLDLKVRYEGTYVSDMDGGGIDMSERMHLP